MNTAFPEPSLEAPQTIRDLYNAYLDYSRNELLSDNDYLMRVINEYPVNKELVLEILRTELSWDILRFVTPLNEVDNEFALALYYGMETLAIKTEAEQIGTGGLVGLARKALSQIGAKNLADSANRRINNPAYYISSIVNAIEIIRKVNPQKAEEAKSLWSTTFRLSPEEIATYFNLNENTQDIDNEDLTNSEFLSQFLSLEEHEITTELEDRAYIIFSQILNSGNHKELSDLPLTDYIEYLTRKNPVIVEDLIRVILPALLAELEKTDDLNPYHLEWAIGSLASGLAPFLINNPQFIEEIQQLFTGSTGKLGHVQGELFWRLALHIPEDQLTEELLEQFIPKQINDNDAKLTYLLTILRYSLEQNEKKLILSKPYFRKFLLNIIAKKAFKINSTENTFVINQSEKPEYYILDTLQDIAQAEEEAGSTPSATSI